MNNDDDLIEEAALLIQKSQGAYPSDVAKEIIQLTRDSECNGFLGFTEDILDIAFDGNEADGATIQEIAEKHGLLKLTKMTEPCSDNCICAEVGNFPQDCFRKTYSPPKQPYE